MMQVTRCTVFLLLTTLLVFNTPQALSGNSRVVNATRISLQGGSHSSVQWRVPAQSLYKIWVYIPNGSTATRATYQLYLRGSAAGHLCSKQDVTYPCFAVTVNQVANRGKWLVLAYSDANKIINQWRFTKGGFISVNARTVSKTQQLGIDAIRFEAMSSPFTVGQNYGGGIIFYIDDTGKHGLIAAPHDQSTGLQWYNDGFYSNTTADKTGIGTGQFNTSAIFKNQGAGFYAASLCNRLIIGSYSDWFLPSKDELALMYKNIGRGAVAPLTNRGGFAARIYWSSSEADTDTAWYQSFTDGSQDKYDKYGGFYVRAVRAF